MESKALLSSCLPGRKIAGAAASRCLTAFPGKQHFARRPFGDAFERHPRQGLGGFSPLRFLSFISCRGRPPYNTAFQPCGNHLPEKLRRLFARFPAVFYPWQKRRGPHQDATQRLLIPGCEPFPAALSMGLCILLRELPHQRRQLRIGESAVGGAACLPQRRPARGNILPDGSLGSLKEAYTLAYASALPFPGTPLFASPFKNESTNTLCPLFFAASKTLLSAESAAGLCGITWSTGKKPSSSKKWS